MFDFLFDGIAGLLSFFFDVTGSIGLSIILLTIAVMGLTAPLTMKGTRSLMKMQRLQPEIRKIQQQHKGDRERLNQELLAFYQANNLNPFGGCLPLLLQFPIFIVLFQVLRGLGNVDDGVADPKYLEAGSALYDKIVEAGGQLISFGFDLADTATSSHSSFFAALPYYLLIVAMGLTSWFQQRQAMGRRDPNTPITPQQQITQRLMIFFLPLISLSIPAGVVIYWVVSNILRIGQQWLIHYLDTRERERNGEVIAKPAPKERKAKAGDEVIDTTAAEKKRPSGRDRRSARGTPAASGSTPTTSGRVTPSGGNRPHPSSKKKRKKRKR